jgi:tRNA dimethylallyltransferase
VNPSKKLIVVLGPTAVGKTKFAAQLAFTFNGEIISADSRQVYKGMDIGTVKDYEDYLIDGSRIITHLIDVIEPSKEFDLFQFTNLFKVAFNDISEREKLPFLVGGTGLYLSAVLQNYSLNKVDFNGVRAKELANYNTDELRDILLQKNRNLHNTTDMIHKQRIINAILVAEQNNREMTDNDEIHYLVLGISDEREVLKERIRERLKSRLKKGMIEEAKELLDYGITHEKLHFFGLEYKFLSQYLMNKLNYNDMYQKLASAIIKFSKRQMTWFRKMEREGIVINWLKNSELSKAESLILNFLEKYESSR